MVLLAVFAFMVTSCRKNDDIITGGPNPVVFVQTQVLGVIRDGNGQGLEGVVVRWGQQTRLTDTNGYFTFDQAPADEEGTLLHLALSGYFDLTRTVVPIPDGRTWLETELTPRILTGVVQSGSGGEIVVDGARVVLPANGYVDETNATYQGEVQVFATRLDPTKASTFNRMPGNLSAIRTNGDDAALATFGMIGVELASPSGEPLQIAPGSTATIELPIPAALQASAPNIIALWHFDADTGRWIEEGTAEKVGGAYVGTVTHFSFWNCDQPFANITLSGRVVSTGGDPVPGVTVKATLVNGSNGNIPASGYAWTNPEGKFSGKVPAGEVFLIEILNACSDVVYSQEWGPFSTDTDLGDLVIDLDNQAITVEAVLKDCDGNPVANGYLKVVLNGQASYLPAGPDGVVSNLVMTCNASAMTVQGVDVGNLKTSFEQIVSLSGDPVEDLGEITVCDALAEYIQFTLGGISELNTDVEGQIQGSSLVIHTGPNTTDSTYFYLTVNTLVPGTFPAQTVEASAFDEGAGTLQFGYCQGSACQSLQVTITEIGNIGEPILGTFIGTIMGGNNPMNPDVNLSGSFRVIRDQ